MSNFFNVLAVKFVREYNANIQDQYEATVRNITLTMYTDKVKNPFISPARAARYYANLLLIDGREAPQRFFLLTVRKEKDESITKEMYEVACNSTAVNTYRNEVVPLGNPKELDYDLSGKYNWRKQFCTKRYCKAAASVLANIKRAAKGKSIIGYTTDEDLAKKFAVYRVPENISNEELKDIWWKFRSSEAKEARLKVLTQAFPQFTRLIPAKIRGHFYDESRCPYDEMGWHIVRHQLELGKPLSEKVYNKAFRVREVLEDGHNLNGLDFSSETQIKAIGWARKKKCLDELRTEDGWRSVEEKDKWLEMNNYTSYFDDDFVEIKIDLSDVQSRTFQDKQLELQQEQIRVQKAAARAPIEARIAELEASLSSLAGESFWTRDPQKRASLDTQMRTIQSQIRNLKDQLRKLE